MEFYIEGSRPERCISTTYHAWDTAFWSGTLDVLSWSTDRSCIKLKKKKKTVLSYFSAKLFHMFFLLMMRATSWWFFPIKFIWSWLHQLTGAKHHQLLNYLIHISCHAQFLPAFQFGTRSSHSGTWLVCVVSVMRVTVWQKKWSFHYIMLALVV